MYQASSYGQYATMLSEQCVCVLLCRNMCFMQNLRFWFAWRDFFFLAGESLRDVVIVSQFKQHPMIVWPGAPSSVLAPSSMARSP